VAKPRTDRLPLKKVKEVRPDLVILDMSMPVMYGLDAAKQITENSPSVPLILFTMFSSDQLSKQAKAVGIKHVLSKEGGLDQLVVSIRFILETFSVAQ
jgi:DNA-binding NarL/FixJ family response regulator